MADKEIHLEFTTDGRVVGIYDDDIKGIVANLTNNNYQIERATHVEPDPSDPRNWIADLSPVGGPVLGPFPERKLALEAEIAYLWEHLGELSVEEIRARKQ